MAAVNRVFGDMGNIGAASDNMDSLMSWIRSSTVLSEDDLDQLYIEEQDWTAALKIVQPSAKREGFVTVPDVTWSDVGALENIRKVLSRLALRTFIISVVLCTVCMFKVTNAACANWNFNNFYLKLSLPFQEFI